jgi:hypothetical protein
MPSTSRSANPTVPFTAARPLQAATPEDEHTPRDDEKDSIGRLARIVFAARCIA